MNKKEEKVVFEGVVVKSLPSALFDVKLDNNHSIKATLSGRMRKNNIKLMSGDRVSVEVSVYDLNRGIIYRRLDVTRKKYHES